MIFNSNFEEEFGYGEFEEETSDSITYLIIIGAFVIAVVIVLLTVIVAKNKKDKRKLAEV